jgi:hypothetical protein
MEHATQIAPRVANERTPFTRAMTSGTARASSRPNPAEPPTPHPDLQELDADRQAAVDEYTDCLDQRIADDLRLTGQAFVPTTVVAGGGPSSGCRSPAPGPDRKPSTAPSRRSGSTATASPTRSGTGWRSWPADRKAVPSLDSEGQ